MGKKQLPDEAIVIRGGRNERKHVEQQAADEFELSGRYALSVGADAEMSLVELAWANRRPNPTIRKTTVGRLRAVGFEVTIPKGTKRHADLILPSPHPIRIGRPSKPLSIRQKTTRTTTATEGVTRD